MITKDSIETAYSFLHQKQRIYVHSTLDWQKDDIEMAIAAYADEMSQELYHAISGGKADVYDDCYWAFQFDLLSIRHIETQEQYLFHFTCRSDSLLLSEPYKAIEQGLDSLLPDNRELLPLGVQSLEEGFKIIELNDKRMKLQSAVLRLSLRKM